MAKATTILDVLERARDRLDLVDGDGSEYALYKGLQGLQDAIGLLELGYDAREDVASLLKKMDFGEEVPPKRAKTGEEKDDGAQV